MPGGGAGVKAGRIWGGQAQKPHGGGLRQDLQSPTELCPTPGDTKMWCETAEQVPSSLWRLSREAVVVSGGAPRPGVTAGRGAVTPWATLSPARLGRAAPGAALQGTGGTMSALTPLSGWRWHDGRAGAECGLMAEQSPQPRAECGGKRSCCQQHSEPSQGGQVSGAGKGHLVAVQTHCQLASYI